MSTASPTLQQLLAAVAQDQVTLAAAATTITNDTNAVSTAQSNVDTAQAALATAQTGLTAAQKTLATDSAALLPDALQGQSDWNALVSFLQAQQPPPSSGSTGSAVAGANTKS